ncbi:MAG: hypothetical protein ABIH82_02695 [Candidatus Woesearchaeota archaeon]
MTKEMTAQAAIQTVIDALEKRDIRATRAAMLDSNMRNLPRNMGKLVDVLKKKVPDKEKVQLEAFKEDLIIVLSPYQGEVAGELKNARPDIEQLLNWLRTAKRQVTAIELIAQRVQ